MPQILLVCTANRCRSPMAEAFLQADLSGSTWQVSSAGLMDGGSPVVEEIEDVMSIYGIDIAPHRSRHLSWLLVEEVDLILGMERHHVRQVTTLQPSAFVKTFTVKEFVRRSSAVTPSGSLEAYLHSLNLDRTTRSMLERDPADEISDPIGGDKEVFERSAAEIHSAMQTVASVLLNLH